MLNKKQLLESLKDLPDQFSIDEVIDRIILLNKVEIGLEQAQNGQVYSDDEAKEKLKKWLK